MTSFSGGFTEEARLRDPVRVHTGTSVVALHPDVAVVLGHAGLRVQEGQPDAPLGAQTGVVAAALLDGILVELVA